MGVVRCEKGPGTGGGPFGGKFNHPNFFAYYCYIALGPFVYLSCLLRILLSITKIGRTIVMIITLVLISAFGSVGGFCTTELGVSIHYPASHGGVGAPLAAAFSGMFLSQLFIVLAACVFVCIDSTEPEKEVQ
ncbi:hypothetical protein EMCRGX_G011051 [Ephydatia muelleri]